MDERIDGIINRLRSRGQRVTPQRIAIIRDFLARTDHPSAEDVYAALRDEYPTMALSTVYSTLGMLVEMGEAAQVSPATSSARFDPNVDDHCHLVCLECRAIIDLPLSDAVPQSASPRLAKKHGFELVRQVHQVFGICADCRKRGSRPSRRAASAASR